MPSNAFAHICMLVEDLDKAVEDWSKILGVVDPHQLDEQLVRYEHFESGGDSMRWATFVSHQGCEIQLMEPGPDTPLGKRLAAKGEHVHHICFTTDDVEATMDRLKAEGIEEFGKGVQQDPTMPWQQWSWISPKSAHGALVEIARPYRAVDGTWESASD